MNQLPHILCPVYGVATQYMVQIAATQDSKELKYALYGAMFLEKGPVEITVLMIFMTSDDPMHVHFLYKDSRDNKVHSSFANGIREIKRGQNIRKASSETEYLCGLHHASSLFIRYPDKKTFIAKAVQTSKVIRGNAYYRIMNITRDGGQIVFSVESDSHPGQMFSITAEHIMQGTWHKVPGTLCPVPGVDPSERKLII